MPGGSATFTNTSTVGDNAPLNYQWNFGDGSPVDNNTNPSHVFPAINTYTVQLTTTSSFGCVNTISKPFNDFYDKPVAAFAVSPDTLCQGANNSFTDQSFAPNSTVTAWNWAFGDGSTSNTQNPTKKYTNAGNYNVSLTVTNTQGCVSTPFGKTVVVYVQPVIDAGPSFVVPQGTVIQFNAKANDSTSVTFLWSPATGLSSATSLRPTLTAMQDQTYTLTATGQGSCRASDFMTVKILKPILIPNAFSPNGDGINDTWVIQNLSDYPGATVDIFNRYGQPLFHSNGYGTPWDGTYKGSPLPVAAYYYVIELKNGYKPLTGSVTILR
jgi:gliding motility-associated-like protein